MKNKNKIDTLGDEILRSLNTDESKIESTTGSPYLYRKIISGIEAEQKRRSENGNNWFTILTEIKHAVPVLTLAALSLLALSIFLPQNSHNTNSNGVEVTSISGDEMVNTVLGVNDGNND